MQTNFGGDIYKSFLAMFQKNGPSNKSMKNEKVGLLRRPMTEETEEFKSEADRAFEIWEMLHTAREEELGKGPLFMERNLPFPHFDKEGNPIQHEFQQKNMPFPHIDEEGNPIPKGSPDDMIQLLPYKRKDILELLNDED